MDEEVTICWIYTPTDNCYGYQSFSTLCIHNLGDFLNKFLSIVYIDCNSEDEQLPKTVEESKSLESHPRHGNWNVN